MASRSFHQDIVTPSGTPLGGWVDLTINDDGTYSVHFHMHSSSILGNFDFQLRAYLNAPGAPVLFFYHAGHVSGVDSEDPGPVTGHNPMIQLYWAEYNSAGSFAVAKDYKWGGVIGAVEGLVKDVVDLVVGAAATAIGTVIAVTSEAIGWLKLNLGPGGTLGVLAGVAVLALTGGTGVILATVAGVAVGAVANALIKSRAMNQAEIAMAQLVFGNTVPYGSVVLTNLSGLNGRAFTAPGVDGKTYVNLGHVFDSTLGPNPSSYPAPAQTLIHELTHAWQIAHSSFLPGLICSGIVTQANHSAFGDAVYDYGPAGQDWGRFGIEQQGAIVDQWFGASGHSEGFAQMDDQSLYFPYVRDNIRAGAAFRGVGWQSWFELSGNGLAAPTTPIAAVETRPNHIDLFTTGADGTVRSTWWEPQANWQPWFQIDAATKFAPAAAVRALTRRDHIDLFAVGTDGVVRNSTWEPAPGWSRWNPLANNATFPSGSAITALVPRTDHIDLFAVGNDGAVHSTYWDPQPSWLRSGWFTIQPDTKFPPGGHVAALLPRTDHIDLFSIAADGTVMSTWWEPQPGWQKWFAIDPTRKFPQAGCVRAITPRRDHIDLFVVGNDGAVWSTWWEPHPGWQKWFQIHPETVFVQNSQLSVLVPRTNHIDLFVTGNDGSIWSTFWEPQPGWQRWFTIKPGSPKFVPGAPVTSLAPRPDHIDLFVVDTAGAVSSIWWE